MQLRALAATMLTMLAVQPCLAQERKDPNVILILADDLGWGDLGCYGQKRIKTPNLDRLASRGVRFTQAYAGSTVCAPSRCSLMTGYHMGHARVRGNGAVSATSLTSSDLTIAKLLKDAGYRTGVFGKWGLGQPDQGGAEGVPSKQGFDESMGYLNHSHAHNYYPSHLWRNEKRITLTNQVPNELASGAGVSTNKLEYSHDLISREAFAFLERSRGQKVFLYWTPTIPHANNEAKAKGMEVPDLGEYANLDLPEPAKGHGAMITRLDRDVGTLISLLSKLGIEKDTIILFTSDNGCHKEGGYHYDMNDSNGPLRGGKRDLYEGGIRVPMIAWGPGRIPEGRVIATPWAFWDVLPTIAELAGVKSPRGIDGLSAASLLRGEAPAKLHDSLYWEFHEGGFSQAARFDDWKAVKRSGLATEIYDLARDIGEQRNLAAERPDLVRQAEAIFSSSRVDSPKWPIKAAGPRKRGEN